MSIKEKLVKAFFGGAVITKAHIVLLYISI